MKTGNQYYLGLILLTLFFASCDNDEPDPVIIKECPGFMVSGGDVTDQEEYQIIDEVIKNNFERFESIQIIDKTQSALLGNDVVLMQEYLLSQQVDLDSTFLAQYLTINAEELRWNDSFQEGALKAEEEKNCFFQGNEFPCESFENKYPNGLGYLSFTRPAYIAETTAIVEYYIDFCSGSRGDFVLLKYENGNWVVDNFFTTIVS